ncbi:uncharacterized protein C6orf201 homolog isoform X2 [Gigantopelta aegis]|uniref:uncharacterized protein C6orf201 homolog isoform X2 n=1 Tax=Gigantopelta aegis TaxID=1735272 RepID=UPI001B88BB0D|nr:uncharacterized protein C6orf201 homolog isoform X2 [Gigantopelta aegis]
MVECINLGRQWGNPPQSHRPMGLIGHGCCLVKAKGLGVEDGDMYYTYSRLLALDTGGAFSAGNTAHSCELEPAVLAPGIQGHLKKRCQTPAFPLLPGQDRLRAKCHEYRQDSPEPSPTKLMNELWDSFKRNHDRLLPMSTIAVRWRLRYEVPNYTLKELYAIMRHYGSIAAMYQTSPNSAIIVFDNILSACRVMHASQLKHLRNVIICSWWHVYMWNKSFNTIRQTALEKKKRYLQYKTYYV